MPNGVQSAEFDRAIAMLRQAIDSGHQQLDAKINQVEELSRETLNEARKTNGRVTTLELVARGNTLRIENLEKAVNLTDSARAITRWDLTVFGGAIIAVISVLSFLGKL